MTNDLLSVTKPSLKTIKRNLKNSQSKPSYRNKSIEEMSREEFKDLMDQLKNK